MVQVETRRRTDVALQMFLRRDVVQPYNYVVNDVNSKTYIDSKT